jgi:uncharacterized protein
LRGEIPIEVLSRLNDILVASHGTLAYVVRGLREGDRHMLEIALSGVFHLRCQRCLGELEYPLDMVSRLRLVSADQLGEIEANNDDVDCIEASSQMDVLELIEDELLLGLPFAPKHPEGACSQPPEGLERSANPFSVLVGLKKKH